MSGKHITCATCFFFSHESPKTHYGMCDPGIDHHDFRGYRKSTVERDCEDYVDKSTVTWAEDGCTPIFGNQMPKPKPCPFCGSTDVYFHCVPRHKPPHKHFLYARCNVCGVQTAIVNVCQEGKCWECEDGFCEGADKAIDEVVRKWNMRFDEK